MKITKILMLALAVMTLAACRGGGGDGDVREHLRKQYHKNPDKFEKHYGVGPGTDKPMPGKDRGRGSTWFVVPLLLGLALSRKAHHEQT